MSNVIGPTMSTWRSVNPYENEVRDYCRNLAKYTGNASNISSSSNRALLAYDAIFALPKYIQAYSDMIAELRKIPLRPSSRNSSQVGQRGPNMSLRESFEQLEAVRTHLCNKTALPASVDSASLATTERTFLAAKANLLNASREYYLKNREDQCKKTYDRDGNTVKVDDKVLLTLVTTFLTEVERLEGQKITWQHQPDIIGLLSKFENIMDYCRSKGSSAYLNIVNQMYNAGGRLLNAFTALMNEKKSVASSETSIQVSSQIFGAEQFGHLTLQDRAQGAPIAWVVDWYLKAWVQSGCKGHRQLDQLLNFVTGRINTYFSNASATGQATTNR